MKKSLFFAILTVAAVLLSGCSTTAPEPSPGHVPAPEPSPAPAPAPEPTPDPAPAPVIHTTLLGDMQKLAAKEIEAGGLAVVGTGESKSLELALNKAKVSGRRELIRALNARIKVLEKAFIDETGMSADSLFLSGFNNTAKVIAEQQIAGSIAQTLKYENTRDTFTAYALMVLDPKVIADQLAKEKDLYARLQTAKAFEEFVKEVKAFAAFKAAQK